MHRPISLKCTQYPELCLRAVLAQDQENLRNWKNANRDRFFFKEEISPADQMVWFSSYLDREDDFMFVVHAGGTDIGCMGFRLRGTDWDIYNVILGNLALGGKGYMGEALRIMCSYAIALRPLRITAQVLNKNPALSWYYRNSFRAEAFLADHTQIELDHDAFVPCLLEVRLAFAGGDS